MKIPIFAPANTCLLYTSTSDSTLLQPRRPWKAALETFGLNMLVWSFDRYTVSYTHLDVYKRQAIHRIPNIDYSDKL